MLWKCCTQHASKFGKLSSGRRTGKGQFSFQSQRKAIPKNAQTTAKLHLSHMLAKWCSKFSKPGFNSMWTVDFQMFKLVLEKAEEPEIKLPTSAGSWKKQESSRKASSSALLTMPKPLTVWITINCGKWNIVGWITVDSYQAVAKLLPTICQKADQNTYIICSSKRRAQKAVLMVDVGDFFMWLEGYYQKEISMEDKVFKQSLSLCFITSLSLFPKPCMS